MIERFEDPWSSRCCSRRLPDLDLSMRLLGAIELIGHAFVAIDTIVVCYHIDCPTGCGRCDGNFRGDIYAAVVRRISEASKESLLAKSGSESLHQGLCF